jgi:hypothetical protein
MKTQKLGVSILVPEGWGVFGIDEYKEEEQAKEAWEGFEAYCKKESKKIPQHTIALMEVRLSGEGIGLPKGLYHYVILIRE